MVSFEISAANQRLLVTFEVSAANQGLLVTFEVSAAVQRLFVPFEVSATNQRLWVTFEVSAANQGQLVTFEVSVTVMRLLVTFEVIREVLLYKYFWSLPHRIDIGYVSRLLPSLEVVAISQAPSPESNPNSPLPVNAMVGLDPTIES